MTIRTVIARNMAEALAMVRQHLGVDARVLHTRTIRRGGVLGIGGREMVEVTAAIESLAQARAPRPKANRLPAGRRPRRASSATAAAEAQDDRRQALLGDSGVGLGLPEPASIRQATVAEPARRTRVASPRESAYTKAYGATVANPTGATAGPLSHSAAAAAASREPIDRSGPAGELIRRTYQAAKAELEKRRVAESESAEPAVAPPVVPRVERVAPASSGEEEGLRQELAAVRKLVEASLRSQHRALSTPNMARPESKADDGETLTAYYRRLIEQEVAQDLAEEVMAEVRGRLGEDGLDDPGACAKAVRGALAGRIGVDASAGRIARAKDDRPTTIALVGPTGVGKTTTLAKLAASFVLQQGAKVGLITLDTYRISAVDQLRTYAQLIGAELVVVRDAVEMRAALARFAGYDGVLIDTAGRSPRDADNLRRQADLLAVADPHEVHLVLSSSCGERALMQAAERFAILGADRVLFTKLDEAVTAGVLLNVSHRLGMRLSFVTTGQEVPHQIEPGNADRLAGLMLDGVSAEPSCDAGAPQGVVAPQGGGR
ncbi:MAG: hypothetical protein AAF288_03975 [Planctomycetota bacterium]